MSRFVPLCMLLAALALPASSAHALDEIQIVDEDARRPPTLIVAHDGAPVKLGIETVKVDIEIAGSLAQTELTLTFRNPHDRVLAGDLYIPITETATISGYGLDIDGQLVDAVVVDKVEARRIFEKEVRKGVDPGLIEWSRGNVFKTRVFPIPAHGTRTIRVSWVQDLETGDDNDRRYRMPLRLPMVKASIAVNASGARPTVVASPLALKFTERKGSFRAEGTQATAFERDLIISFPSTKGPVTQIERGEDGETWFVVRDTLVSPTTAAPAIEGVRVVWDASMSRATDTHADSIRVLGRWLASQKGLKKVELVVFRNTAGAPQHFALPGQRPAFVAALKAIQYDGATTIGDALFTKTDGFVNVLVSDGGHDFGAATDGVGMAPIYAMGVGSAVDSARLSRLADASGGAYLSLARMADDAIVAALGRPVFQLMRVRGDGVRDLTPNGAAAVAGPVLVSGRLTAARTELTLEYGYGGKALVTRKVTLDAEKAVDSRGVVRRFSAQQRLAGLLAAPDQNISAVRELGKTYGLVTPHTSLLVLETLGQHIEHNVQPPPTRVKMRKEWLAAKAEQGKTQVAQRKGKLEAVIAMWSARVKWWEKSYDYPKNFRFGGSKDSKSAADDSDRNSAPVTSARESTAMPAPVVEEAEADREDSGVARAKKKGKRGASEPDPVAAIALTPWNPDTPYLRALKAAKKDAWYTVYLAQRKIHGTAPAFYLDCADFFSRNGDASLALRILSNLAEMKIEDVALTRVLAHRLTQWESLDLAVYSFEAALRMRPEEPQSYRDLALVLARRAAVNPKWTDKKGDYSRALALLEKVIMGEWSRFAEIEVIALTELNNIWPAAKAAGVAEPGVDKRLIKQLDMDIRIVMNWDADMTDMDLHVVEPSTERAYYGHNRTTIGGMVTRDFTAGYGPEVYGLRKAMHGEYQVRTKFYGSSAAQLLGAVTLQVDVYTNFGRKTQQRKSMTLRLTESGDDFLVGTIEL
ncbi:MAG: Ca-activated chloride channel family protein [Myxococcota bacterium]|jgi:Ca-activated chloride channel family protein